MAIMRMKKGEIKRFNRNNDKKILIITMIHNNENNKRNHTISKREIDNLDSTITCIYEIIIGSLVDVSLGFYLGVIR